MTMSDLVALLPLLILAATAVATLLAIAVRRHHGATAAIAMAGLAAAAAALIPAASLAPRDLPPLLQVDSFALVYWGLVILATLAVAAMASGYWRRRDLQCEEFYVLLVVAALGSAVLAASRNFVSLFLGLETLSVALYGLIAYRRDRGGAAEAGLKYLILAAASSAFLLLGMALIYADAGTMELTALASHLRGGAHSAMLVLAGIVLILTGAGFKLAAVPFHMWTPDVYQGAPAPVTAFIATVSKAGMLAALLRFFHATSAMLEPSMFGVVAVMAVGSMFAGNLLALLQDNVKRMLAYSSIAHMGYMLVAFVAAGAFGAEAVTFYLLAYVVTSLIAFGVVTVLSDPSGDRQDLDAYRGLLWRRPWLAAAFTAALLSLAGIPLTAGFVGKVYVVAAGAGASLWALLVALVVNSVISVYYYLRVVVTMSAGRDDAEAGPLPAVTAAAVITLAVLVIVLLWIGALPSAFIDLVRPAAAALG